MAIILLPDELIDDILLLLPIVTLLRFRCVSKKWRDLIDSPDFVKSYKKAHSMVIFLGRPNYYHAYLDSICNDTVLKLKELTNPCLGRRVSEYFGVVGPCNGLLCIATDVNGIFCLWNPSIGKHFHVPKLPLRLPEDMLLSWGLGYDCDSDDYIIVSISMYYVVWVYSLKYGSWESIDHFPYLMSLCWKRGVFVNGALHWIVGHNPARHNSNIIVAFDLGKLGYTLVPQPESMQNEIKIQCVGVFDGCLYAVYQDRDTNASELWVMKEYGVKESWTRLIACPGFASILAPLAYTEAGDLLLWVSPGNSQPTILRYEFETRLFIRTESFKEVFSHSLPNLHRSLVYVPNLVCPQIAWKSCVGS